jgi:hypothetical protein
MGITGAKMTPKELSDAKSRFEDKLKSLDNDARRAFFDFSKYPCLQNEKTPGYAPFPIAMYAFAVIDYFSSCWAGWNEPKAKDSLNKAGKINDSRSQTQRMADFLKEFLNYPKWESHLAIQFWRHKLMHTAEPRILADKAKNLSYQWCIAANATDEAARGYLLELAVIAKRTPLKHWHLYPNVSKNRKMFVIGVFDLLADLRNGVLDSPNSYFKALEKETSLQNLYGEFQAELANYTFKFQS